MLGIVVVRKLVARGFDSPQLHQIPPKLAHYWLSPARAQSPTIRSAQSRARRSPVLHSILKEFDAFTKGPLPLGGSFFVVCLCSCFRLGLRSLICWIVSCLVLACAGSFFGFSGTI